MKSLWSNKVAKKIKPLSLKMRVYTSQLLGQDEDLVMHGGGNTSVKLTEKGKLGTENLLYIKGSGWDLETIEEQGFAPVKMESLMKMLELDKLSDAEMVYLQRASMTNPFAPNPSVEALLHALIPHKYVDHTHADAVVTITNTSNAKKYLKEIYGDNVLVIPYVMPGFILAKEIYRITKNVNWSELDAMILMNHGVFTFDEDAKTSYQKMIEIVSKAENFLKKKGAKVPSGGKKGSIDFEGLAAIRKAVSEKRGAPVLASVDNSAKNTSFSNHPEMSRIANRGPITPDHVIRTKAVPVILAKDSVRAIDVFEEKYQSYFNKFNDGKCTILDPAPRWGVWKGHGTISFGKTSKEVRIVSDIVKHTIKAIQQGEKLGGWKPLPKRDLFDMEYWELEQAKLKKGNKASSFQGKIALVTGAANGIGKACVEALLKEGAVVAALDINPQVASQFASDDVLGIQCDVTNIKSLKSAVEKTVGAFGGLDLLVSNAGIFPKSMKIADMDQKIWNRSLDLNLSSHQMLIHLCAPYFELGIEPAVVLIGSKNVPAPGPGASAYSVAKAGLTQLGRVAALELGPIGTRVNVIHPNAVYDTGVWTDEVLKTRAKNYGLSVQEYKTNNLLGVEVTSGEVAALVVDMLGPVFSKITGAQIPIDGGNDRVI
jgi:rhamnose utilization protein RhaD (predicted bifunctional aldolase and dehydrogenase)/NAD(P)-dependent dehydrogenase (short-subunit alcohol dehydrogenase family)